MGKKLLRNNSNLYECEDGVKWNGELWRALRKERFKANDVDKVQEAYEELLFKYSLSCQEPSDLAEFRLDINKYLDTLNGRLREASILFMQGYSPNQIAECLGVSKPTARRYRSILLEGFTQYYLEQDND